MAPFFDPPYYEWTQVDRDPVDGTYVFDVPALEKSMAQIESVFREHGGFDGLIGFSQGAMLASSVTCLQHRGLFLQVRVCRLLRLL